MNMSSKEISEMIAEMDYAGNGKINYSEFISATINVKTFLNDTRLRAIFQQFDTDNTGFITEDNLYYAF
jgi:calcium-dependent protein kinase